MLKKNPRLLALISACFLPLFSALPSAWAEVVISEILYRPGTAFPENTALEFVELHNPDAAPVDLSGWALTKGIAFTFPGGAGIAAGGYVVVAANPAAVQAAYGISGVFGPWAAGATLSNKDETLALSRPGLTPGTFVKVSEVHYASEGDWATRVRETTFNGWDWSTPANGGGRSMELRNAALSNDHGRNWAPSTAGAGATPGTVNSVATVNVPPIIHDVKHAPAVPRSTDAVTISCKLTDETAPAGLTAALLWRNATGVTPGAFQSVPLTGDGTGRFSATLGALPHLSIVEFYVSATDGAGTTTWPAPTSEGQNANCQYQVSNEVFDANEVYQLLILTAAENAAYNALATANPNSDRQFNMTFVAVRASETSIRYRSSMRIRGNSSRTYLFKPLRISLPFDDRLEGVSDFNLNPRTSYAQFLGFRMAQAAGLRAEDAVPVKPRRNGVEYSTSTGSTPDYGRWVRVEELNGDLADKHWPLAKGGNLYKKGRGTSGGDGFWRATRPAPALPTGLLDGWSKQSNSSAHDWSDLTTFLQTWQTAAAPHFPGSAANDVAEATGISTTTIGNWDGSVFTNAEIAALETVADLDQWARWFAVMTILQDNETNVSNGQDDDYGAYFAPAANGRRRLHFIPHDLDTIMGGGDAPLGFSSRGLYDATADGSVFRPLLPLLGNNVAAGNAAFRTKYHDALRELYGTVFDADTKGGTVPYPPFHAFLDNHLGGWVPTATITTLKTFATNRQGYLLGLIGSGAITPPAPTSTSTLTSPHGPLMISEVLAHNVAAVQSGAAFPDIIELHNSGATDLELGGLSLTDDAALPAKYILPAGTMISAGDFLLVQADSDLAAPGLHADFALDQDGDTVRLYDSAANGGALLDAVTFGPQPADFSISRTGAALDVWALTAPTPGAANGAPVALESLAGVRLNELLTNPDYLSADDFAELYNPAAQPVALGGVAVTDDFINYPTRQVLPPLSFIGAQSFLVLRPKGGAASPGNPTELAFKFSADTTWAAMLGANGTMIDQLDTGALPPDFSRGRLPDGGVTLANFGLPAQIPTPGAANVPPPASILALLNHLRVTEILYKPNNLEFIELQNIGTSALNLSGVRFTGGIGYTFDAGTTLARGAYLVICKERTAFLAQFGAGIPLAPRFFTGTLDNAGETVTLQPPPPWDVNILNFAYSPTWYPETDLDHSLFVKDSGATPARDWDERETWGPSAQLYGSPGAGAPPVITSLLTASGVISDASFFYRITASQFPTAYTASGLPGGLLLDTATGSITGVPEETGVFNVTISASNVVGGDSATLVLTIAETGPLASFVWNTIAGPQKAGVPFAVTLQAFDAGGHPITSFSGPAQVSAQRQVAVSTLVFTEVGTSSPTPDYFEIQNVSGAAVNATGWFVVTNTTSGGVDSALGVTWALPATVPPGQIIGASDTTGALAPTETAYGADIDWPGNTPQGWAMLVDGGGAIRDFVAWGYTAAQIATISVTSGGFALRVGAEWSGNGAPVIPAGQSLFRNGTSDTHGALDWSIDVTPSPRGTQNIDLTVPMAPVFAPLSASPNGVVNLVNGVWTGSFNVLDTASSAELQATATGLPLARSNAFAVNAATANTAPLFTKGADRTVFEDAGAQSFAGWAGGIRPGATSESAQTLSFLVISDKPELFAAPPAVQTNGTLTFTPAPDANGTASVTIRAQDNGGTANGGQDMSAPQTFTVTVLVVNDAPAITTDGNLSVTQIAGAQTVVGWATGIGGSPADEVAQTLDLQVTTSNPTLFTTAPALATNGTLTFTPAPDASGTANVTITLKDNGGTANGGQDTTQRSFTITTRVVNHPPVFTTGANLVVPVRTAYSQAWATNISSGAPGESGQTVAFFLTNDRPDLFSTPPAISPDGVLTFKPGKSAGIATISVRLRDNGGTGDGGLDTGAAQVFTIQLTSASTARGAYRGLIEAPEGAAQTSARLGCGEFMVTATGQFTGKILLRGKTWPVSGALNNSGVATFGRNGSALPLPRAGLPALRLNLQTDLAGPVRKITGRLIEGSATFAQFTAGRDGYDADHKVPTALRDPATDNGNYTGVFAAQPAPNGGLGADRFPQGDGWVVLKVKGAGAVKLRGQFADGTPFVYTSHLNAANGFPFYTALYGNKGAVAGHLAFNTVGPTTIETSGLTWFRPAKAGALYPQGWSTGLALGFDGAARNAITEKNVLPIGNATLTLAGGNLAAEGFSKALSIGANNRVSIPQPGLDKTAITLEETGEWSGTFIHPVSGKRSTLHGVVLRHRNAAAGFFLGTSESGHATIEPEP